MGIATKLSTVERLYDLSQELGNQPHWLDDEHRAFEEVLHGNSQEARLSIRRTPYHIELGVNLLPISTTVSGDADFLNCFLEYLLTRNSNLSPIYYAIVKEDEVSIVVLRSVISLSPDPEATLGHYVATRHDMVRELNDYGNNLMEVLEDCKQ